MWGNSEWCKVRNEFFSCNKMKLSIQKILNKKKQKSYLRSFVSHTHEFQIHYQGYFDKYCCLFHFIKYFKERNFVGLRMDINDALTSFSICGGYSQQTPLLLPFVVIVVCLFRSNDDVIVFKTRFLVISETSWVRRVNLFIKLLKL